MSANTIKFLRISALAAQAAGVCWGGPGCRQGRGPCTPRPCTPGEMELEPGAGHQKLG